jgi:signal transduction histidine kinase
LNSIRLQLELLKRRLQKGIASATEVHAAMEQVDRLDAILGQLLAFGKPDFGHRRMLDVVPLAHRSVDLVQERARSKSVDLRVIAEGSLHAHVDAVQIEQVLTNLLLNAVEASPANAEVTVQVAGSGAAIEIRVSDHGTGIPDSIRDHVFDAFFTTRTDGTGLGLSVSREIVAAHGGSLEFTSKPGATTFSVRLPLRNGH